MRRRLHVTDVIMLILGTLVLAAFAVGTLAAVRSGRYDAADWMRFVVYGLTQGSVYALIALGYTLVYGILRMINFAHGEVFSFGAFTTYFLANFLNRRGFLDAQPIVSLALLLVSSCLISMVVAVSLERIAYRPLRRAPRLIPLITAIGASFFLQYTLLGLYGSGTKTYPDIDLLRGRWTILGVTVLREQAVVVLSAVLLMIVLYTFVQRTKMGQAMRAVSENKDVAALMGIDVDRTIVATFAVGGALAGAAGVLYALIFGQVNAFMGFFPGLKAFTAAVLGGIGNVPGAMLGGLFLGIVESIGPLPMAGLGVDSPGQLKDAIAFTMLVLVLIFRPTGILGEQVTKRA
jgi:branched-chain amino acid transport system permease protein